MNVVVRMYSLSCLCFSPSSTVNITKFRDLTGAIATSTGPIKHTWDASYFIASFKPK